MQSKICKYLSIPAAGALHKINVCLLLFCIINFMHLDYFWQAPMSNVSLNIFQSNMPYEMQYLSTKIEDLFFLLFCSKLIWISPTTGTNRTKTSHEDKVMYWECLRNFLKIITTFNNPRKRS